MILREGDVVIDSSSFILAQEGEEIVSLFFLFLGMTGCVQGRERERSMVNRTSSPPRHHDGSERRGKGGRESLYNHTCTSLEHISPLSLLLYLPSSRLPNCIDPRICRGG